MAEDTGFGFRLCWQDGLLAKRTIGQSPWFATADERDDALAFLQKNTPVAPTIDVPASSIPPMPQPQFPMENIPRKIVSRSPLPQQKIVPVVPAAAEAYALDSKAITIMGQTIAPHIASRILRFLNRVETAAAISAAVRDNPNVGNEQGKGIGQTVAQRIMDRRESLAPFQRFNDLSQLEDIQGLGPDKFHDLVHAFDSAAAEDFKRRMYDEGVIYDNWKLDYHTTRFRSQEEFERIALNNSTLTQFVADEVQRISEKRFGNKQAAYLADLLLQKSYLERFEIGHFASIAFAFWFYKFDADNWFSFERIRAAVEPYFSYYPNSHNRLELVLFKGFPNSGILVQAITADDLPVVLNFAEKAITVWVAELYD